MAQRRLTRKNGARGDEVVAQQDAFLNAYQAISTISGAAAQTGIARQTHYKWLEKDAAYAARFTQADDIATERLEQEARRRAMVGVEEPVYYRGQPVGAVRKYSDVLLIFLLKARRPEVYRERHDVQTSGSQDVRVTFGGRYRDGESDSSPQ